MAARVPFILALGLTLAAQGARAEGETPPASEPAASAPAAEPAASTPAATAGDTGGDGEEAPRPKPRRGRRTTREKEAEGSQAPNRFEADTVIKSQYRLDGQPLEVDPD